MPDPDENQFMLDRQLAWDSEHVLWLELCEVRLLNDSRWPWLVLVPQREGLTEIHELDPLDQTMLALETNLTASTLKAMTGCEKINTGALGNIVRQLHVHVVARSAGDANWPGPVWGHGKRAPYKTGELARMIDALRTAFDLASKPSEED